MRYIGGMWNVVDHLLSKGFGTQGRLAAAANVGQVAVSGWKERNRIPYDRIAVVREAAPSYGVVLDWADFFPPDGEQLKRFLANLPANQRQAPTDTAA